MILTNRQNIPITDNLLSDLLEIRVDFCLTICISEDNPICNYVVPGVYTLGSTDSIILHATLAKATGL